MYPKEIKVRWFDHDYCSINGVVEIDFKTKTLRYPILMPQREVRNLVLAAQNHNAALWDRRAFLQDDVFINPNSTVKRLSFFSFRFVLIKYKLAKSWTVVYFWNAWEREPKR